MTDRVSGLRRAFARVLQWVQGGTAWLRGQAKESPIAARTLLAVVLVVILLALDPLHLAAPRKAQAPAEQAQAAAPDWAATAQQLGARIAALEAAQNSAPPAMPPTYSPTAKRAPAAPQRGALSPASEQPAPSAWGTTDLDRAIAAYPSTNLEQVK